MNLEELRKQIDEIDKEMMVLFKKRMSVSKQIGEYKRVNNVPILDVAREIEIMNKKKKELNDELLWPYYESFIKEVMSLSKDYQK
ncbi:MAG: chorismate mutase [Tenericutes bacterium HGW-Tenericutes-6]|nr:MAG: chorismate mutase [Tenericutes bacterium HGW-Tenericutes-7]PKK92677.1 MAG: chorismate mutase [Tenericutes bacterium HGW-Tenericutes-6]PKK96330.1 MAG: chorismate mutase [Tenericutes bacterium HGW-Tenericutes-3]